MDKFKNYIILFFGVFALSSSAIFVKLANAPASIMAFYRLFFAALILLPFMILSKTSRREIFNLTKKEIKTAVIAGFYLAIHYVLWFESLNYTSVASSIVIVTLQPIFSMLLGYFLLKEKYNILAVLGCLIAIFGSFIIGYGDFKVGIDALIGDIMAFAAAGFVSCYFYVGQVSRKNISALTYSVLGYFASVVFLGVYVILKGDSFLDYPIFTWYNFIGIALIATVFGQFIFNILLKKLPATTISMSILGETIGTCIMSYFILNEIVTLKQGIGMIVILSGLTLYFLSIPILKKIRGNYE